PCASDRHHQSRRERARRRDMTGGKCSAPTSMPRNATALNRSSSIYMIEPASTDLPLAGHAILSPTDALRGAFDFGTAAGAVLVAASASAHNSSDGEKASQGIRV